MKRLTLLCCLALTVLSCYPLSASTPETSGRRQSERQKSTGKNNNNAELSSAQIESMIESRQFVLEIDFINDQARNFLNTGAWINVNKMGNYIALNNEKIIMSFEPNEYQTSNWPFGISPDNGIISSYKITNPRKTNDSYLIRFRSDDKSGLYDVSITISDNGKTELRLKNNLGLTINFRGVMVPLSHSKISPVFI